MAGSGEPLGYPALGFEQWPPISKFFDIGGLSCYTPLHV